MSHWTRSPQARPPSPSPDFPSYAAGPVRVSAFDAFVPPEASLARAAVLRGLADRVVAVRPGERAVVALDGVDGAGKTVLGRELAAYLAGRREVHRASVDGFHRPRVQRYAHGRTGETFYEDSYDYDSLQSRLVEPFRDGKPFVTAVFDVLADAPVTSAPVVAGPDALLVVDGIFLHRPELVDLWDASVWVDVPFAIAVPRGNARFGPVGTAEADPCDPKNARYVEGQRHYVAMVAPTRRATWVLDNTDLDQPSWRVEGRPECGLQARPGPPEGSSGLE